MRQRKASERPAELSMYVPRAVRLNGAGRLVAGIAIAMAAAGWVVPSIMWMDRERKADLRARIEREGVAARAVVTATGKTSGDHPRRFAEYRYARGSGRAFLARDEPLGRGDEIAIRYLPGEPWRSWALGEEPAGPPLGLIPGLAASFSLASWLIAWSIRRQWQLLAEGRAATGRVVAVKRTKRSDGRREHRAEFEITLLSGAVRRIWAEADKASVEGASVAVIYDPENPKRLRPYPLSLVEIARY